MSKPSSIDGFNDFDQEDLFVSEVNIITRCLKDCNNSCLTKQCMTYYLIMERYIINQIVVLNHELSILGLMQAFTDQCVTEVVIWDAERKEYLGVMTLRCIISLLLFFSNSLQECGDDKKNLIKQIKQIGDEELKISVELFQNVTIFEWFTLSPFYSKQMILNLTNEQEMKEVYKPLLECQEEEVFALIDKTNILMQGYVSQKIFTQYLIENFEGELPLVFQQSIISPEIELGARDYIFKAYEDDSVIEVFKMIQEYKISMIPIINRETLSVIGFLFTNDVLLIIRTLQFERQPVINLLKYINEVEIEISDDDKESFTDATGLDDIDEEDKKEAISQGDDLFFEYDDDSVKSRPKSPSLLSKNSRPEDNQEKLMEELKNLKNRQINFGELLGYERIGRYYETDTVKEIIQKVVSVPEKRLVMLENSTSVGIDSNTSIIQVKGIITLTDVFGFLSK